MTDGYVPQHTQHQFISCGRRIERIMSIQYRGHTVIDQEQRMIGTIDDVLYDAEGSPTWAIVDVGLLRASHFVPIEAGYTADDGAFVVPFDKQTVTSSPKADRSHTIDPATETELRQYYGISHENDTN